MAFDKTPTTWIDDYSVSNGDIVIPIATFDGLSSAEADAETGDIRQIVLAICNELYSVWENTQAIDKPTKMTMARSRAYNDVTSTMVETYTFSFQNTIVDENVKDEA